MTTKDKNLKIQILRAFAIIAVVIIHSRLPSVCRIYIRPFVNFAVALFVFISGYLTKVDIPDYKSFMLKRIKRVGIPYLLWSVIYMAPQGFKDFLPKLLTGRCCGVYYYILVYIQLVVLTPLIIKLLKSKFYWTGLLITPITTIIFVYLTDFPILNPNFKWFFFAWISYYLLGMMLGNNIPSKITISNSKILPIYSVTMIISIAEAMYWYYFKGKFGMAIAQSKFSCLLASIAVIFIAYNYLISNTKIKDNKLTKFLLLLGDCSFGIYLTHILIKRFLQLVFKNTLFFPIDTIIILAVSTACVFIGKKILKKYSWVLGL